MKSKQYECMSCGAPVEKEDSICAECWYDYENDTSDVFIPFDDDDDDDSDYEPTDEELQLFRQLIERVLGQMKGME